MEVKVAPPASLEVPATRGEMRDGETVRIDEISLKMAGDLTPRLENVTNKTREEAPLLGK